MKLLHVLRAVYTEPWLITPEMHRQISAIVQNHLEPHGEIDFDEMMKPAPDDECEMVSDVAVIGIQGVIGNKISALEKSSGVCGVDSLQRTLETAMDNPMVNGVLLVVDSPGGGVSGVPELATFIRDAKEYKPIMAFANGGMNSAAYWICSGASAIYATESATVGSIGVYLPILDSSRWMEMNGLKMEVFKTDELKGIGIEGTSLTDEQRTFLQNRVDRLGDKFKNAIRAGRGFVIDPAYMRGQSLDSDEALEANLIDGVTDIGGVLREMQSAIRMKNN